MKYKEAGEETHHLICSSIFSLILCLDSWTRACKVETSAAPPNTTLPTASAGSGTKAPTAVTAAVPVINAHASGCVFMQLLKRLDI
jgi:hypothetical protein